MPHTIEGSWEDVLARSAELAGRRVRVTVLDPLPESPPTQTPLRELLQDYIGSVRLANSPGARHARADFGEILADKHRAIKSDDARQSNPPNRQGDL